MWCPRVDYEEKAKMVVVFWGSGPPSSSVDGKFGWFGRSDREVLGLERVC